MVLKIIFRKIPLKQNKIAFAKRDTFWTLILNVHRASNPFVLFAIINNVLNARKINN